ncbi:MAG: 3-hydroxyacyl-ACP dehydratase FabZ [Clostridia bacterium]|nr:3-hydroxyacyl-ACP dehydratase FabZ [Clostridia bacterium]
MSRLSNQSLLPLLSLPVQRIMTQEEIKQNIPHRDPFLLVDEVRILEEGKSCIGVKKVTGEEYFFKGHFPQKPIMPGVLVLESISQAFGGAMMPAVSQGKGIPLFLGIENAKFRGMVVPGDLLEMPIQILRLGKLSRIYAEAYVNGKLCTEAYLTFILGENLHV